ncbi:carbohydrate kinase [Segetibacter sp. 3557_3]|uniref:bifunctional heptose 7-phosphate kinase/heptose 1-phosphate adenyltransferase n=1 Tax=Segetibacter sp. 3557_3 TaxID=2547429 RepID=UPI001058434F|nr:PfkB family carbohydrate kinase [Segetibacter sp. 3557_3]TDH27835.1 carbohydrate kinase [Segetibacter sp. 3557_3]
MHDFHEIFNRFLNLKVAVIGDVMLDTYWFGTVDRISPEGPVPIVDLKNREVRIGGAGNVALNIVALGASASLFSVIGKDEEGRQLTTLFKENQIDTNYLVASESRITTNKTRIICRNQQMMRLDSEVTTNLNPAEESELIEKFRAFVHEQKPAVVIFEDYNKGVLTPKTIREILDLCAKLEIPVTVDPKQKNFFSYKGATIFKPNLAEVKAALNLLPEGLSDDALPDIHRRLKEVLEHKISLITLSERGVFYQENGSATIIPTHVRKVADVSGAGDTVIAVASLVFAATSDIRLSAAVANLAGGLVCEEVGTVAINKQRLFDECTELLT